MSLNSTNCLQAFSMSLNPISSVYFDKAVFKYLLNTKHFDVFALAMCFVCIITVLCNNMILTTEHAHTFHQQSLANIISARHFGDGTRRWGL